MAQIRFDTGQRLARPTMRDRSPERMRIGALSIFALVIIVCLAILAVLAFSTSQAALAMSQRQAAAETQRYLAESAAQQFVADLDDVLDDLKQSRTDASGAVEKGEMRRGVEQNLEGLCAQASAAVQGKVHVNAELEGAEVKARFDCENGRCLDVVVSLGDDAAFEVQQWKMSAVQNQEQPQGQLLTID